MKNIILSTIFIALSQGAFAGQIIDGQYDSQKNQVILTIAHSGGCGSHDFYLQFGEINYQDYQRTVQAKLLHQTEDNCEALLINDYKITVGRAVKRPSDLTITSDDGSSITVHVE